MTDANLGLDIIVGANNLHETLTKYKASHIKVHEKYDRSYPKYDIALVRVSKPIEYSDKVDKIALQTETLNDNYTSAVFTGWGITEVSFFNKMKYVKKNYILIYLFIRMALILKIYKK